MLSNEEKGFIASDRGECGLPWIVLDAGSLERTRSEEAKAKAREAIRWVVDVFGVELHLKIENVYGVSVDPLLRIVIPVGRSYNYNEIVTDNLLGFMALISGRAKELGKHAKETTH